MDWKKFENWSLPAQGVIKTIEAHTGGEPLRVFVSGLPKLTAQRVLENRRLMETQFDSFRTSTMWEPRGHADMYGCVITQPEHPASDFGVMFLHNEGYSTMCGHAIIAISKIAVETGLVESSGEETQLQIDTPAGVVKSRYRAHPDGGHDVAFENVPSFVVELDASVIVPEVGEVRYDLAFGGAYYAYVSADAVGVQCNAAHYPQLIELGKRIKQAISETREIVHPRDDDLGFLYGVIFVGDSEQSGNHSRNVCVFADGEVDRSPTGTGVSGRAAIHFARGELEQNQPIRIESIIGSTFSVFVKETSEFYGIPSVIPVVCGQAFITGISEFWFDKRDPLKDGFLLR